mgnify:CR=1 FL=1
MSIVIEGKTTFQYRAEIGPSIIEPGLIMYFDPNNTDSYPGTGTAVTNIAPASTNNGVNGTLDAASMYVDPAGSAAYFRVRSDSVVQRLELSSTISRDADDGSTTIMFYFWSNYDGTGQYGNSQAFFGGKYTNYMAIRGGTDGTYGAEAETNGGDDGNHDYMANENNVFATGSWQSWTNVIDGGVSSNYFNGTLHGTTYPMANNAVHSFSRLGSSSTGTGSGNRGGDIRMGALLMYNRALTATEVRRNLSLLDRRFRD